MILFIWRRLTHCRERIHFRTTLPNAHTHVRGRTRTSTIFLKMVSIFKGSDVSDTAENHPRLLLRNALRKQPLTIGPA